MPDYARLRAELLADPAGLGYAGLSDQAASDRIGATDTGRTLARTAVPASEILGAIDNGAWPTTAILQDKLRGVLGIDPIDTSNDNIRGILGAIFPVGGQTGATRTRLLALSERTVSRAEELGLGAIEAEDVRIARSGIW